MEKKMKKCLLFFLTFSLVFTSAQDKPESKLEKKKSIEINKDWLEGSTEQREVLQKLEGKAASALQLNGWQKSAPLDLSKLKGKVVVLDFWATWCGPCIASIPKNNEIHKKYKDKGVVFIGICHPQGSEKMNTIVEDHKIEYPVAIDPEGKTIEAYKVNSYPDYYIIDRDGKILVADCKNGNVVDVLAALFPKVKDTSKKEK